MLLLDEIRWQSLSSVQFLTAFLSLVSQFFMSCGSDSLWSWCCLESTCWAWRILEPLASGYFAESPLSCGGLQVGLVQEPLLIQLQADVLFPPGFLPGFHHQAHPLEPDPWHLGWMCFLHCSQTLEEFCWPRHWSFLPFSSLDTGMHMFWQLTLIYDWKQSCFMIQSLLDQDLSHKLLWWNGWWKPGRDLQQWTVLSSHCQEYSHQLGFCCTRPHLPEWHFSLVIATIWENPGGFCSCTSQSRQLDRHHGLKLQKKYGNLMRKRADKNLQLTDLSARNIFLGMVPWSKFWLICANFFFRRVMCDTKYWRSLWVIQEYVTISKFGSLIEEKLWKNWF